MEGTSPSRGLGCGSPAISSHPRHPTQPTSLIWLSAPGNGFRLALAASASFQVISLPNQASEPTDFIFQSPSTDTIHTTDPPSARSKTTVLTIQIVAHWRQSASSPGSVLSFLSPQASPALNMSRHHPPGPDSKPTLQHELQPG